MGFLDFIILSTTGTVLIVTLLTFLFSIHSTDEPAIKKAKLNTYIPVLMLCSMVLILYIFAVSIVNII